MPPNPDCESKAPGEDQPFADEQALPRGAESQSQPAGASSALGLSDPLGKAALLSEELVSGLHLPLAPGSLRAEVDPSYALLVRYPS